MVNTINKCNENPLRFEIVTPSKTLLAYYIPTKREKWREQIYHIITLQSNNRNSIMVAPWFCAVQSNDLFISLFPLWEMETWSIQYIHSVSYSMYSEVSIKHPALLNVLFRIFTESVYYVLDNLKFWFSKIKRLVSIKRPVFKKSWLNTNVRSSAKLIVPEKKSNSK